jgi:hypothetical protein
MPCVLDPVGENKSQNKHIGADLASNIALQRMALRSGYPRPSPPSVFRQNRRLKMRIELLCKCRSQKWSSGALEHAFTVEAHEPNALVDLLVRYEVSPMSQAAHGC